MRDYKFHGIRRKFAMCTKYESLAHADEFRKTSSLPEESYEIEMAS